MALTQALFRILDNEAEPLAKRLRVADNAFNSVDLALKQLELVLLKWIGKFHREEDAWRLFHGWVVSDQFRDLSRGEVDIEDTYCLLNEILSCLHSAPTKSVTNIVVKSTIAMLDNRVLQQHFRQDVQRYCRFIADTITNINDDITLVEFVKCQQIFNKQLMLEDEFHAHFFKDVLPTLAMATTRFSGNVVVYEEITKFVEKCVFVGHFKDFQTYFTSFFGKDKIPNGVPKKLFALFKSSSALSSKISRASHKIVFRALCTCYDNDFAMIYKGFVVLLSLLGVDLREQFEHSRKISVSSNVGLYGVVADLLEILSLSRSSTECKLSWLPFNGFLRNLIKSVVAGSKRPDADCFRILHFTIVLDPLVIEPVLGEVLPYIMLSDCATYAEEYKRVMVAIVEVFAKLHRVQNLFAQMTRALKTALYEGPVYDGKYGFLCGDVEVPKVEFKYSCKDILPVEVVERFSACVTSLASWQVINLYKTLLFHLGDAMGGDFQLIIKDEQKILYVEIMSALTCQFLTSVRVAEHTVTGTVVEKFVKVMEEQKVLLAKFGTALVSMEHNHILMKAYLDICYTWAELYILVCYYTTGNEFVKQLDNDLSACNFSYIHSYLTSEQWCLISERITNFGEKPCKQIMQKLCLQKLRAMRIFESEIPEETLQPIVSSLVNSPEDNYQHLTTDKFALLTVLSRAESTAALQFADCILKDIIAGELKVVEQITESRPLCGALLYACCKKINRMFKNKRKHDADDVKRFCGARVFALLPVGGFITGDLEIPTEEIGEILKNAMNGETIGNTDGNFVEYLRVVTSLPVAFLNENVQTALFLYLSAILVDLRNGNVDVLLRKQTEDILIGIAQHGVVSPSNLFKTNVLIKFIITHFTDYKKMFELFLEGAAKSDGWPKKIKQSVSYLTKDMEKQENIHCCIAILKCLQQHKKTKMSQEDKTILESHKNTICDSIIQQIEMNEDFKCVETFAAVYKISLTSNDTENIEKLQKHLGKFIELAFNIDSNEGILLFLTMLQHKPKFEKQLKGDFVLKMWNYARGLTVCDDHSENSTKLVMGIFEHIPEEEFKTVTTDLLNSTTIAINSNDVITYNKEMQTWNSILGCSFNVDKTKSWQEALQRLLLQVFHFGEDKNKSFWTEMVKFQIHLAQTTQLLLTSTILDAYFYTISFQMKNHDDFHATFINCVTILEVLLKQRRAVVCDRLPSYLQQYRTLLQRLCEESNSNRKSLESSHVKIISDCAHRLEKLTNGLIGLEKHMASVAIYVIADILKQYETVTLYPAVKIHLNNCLYSLISLCSQHSISCLMRVLSTASTEIFKLAYDTYKKYYRYTGKV